jgi:hypothetical protein
VKDIGGDFRHAGLTSELDESFVGSMEFFGAFQDAGFKLGVHVGKVAPGGFGQADGSAQLDGAFGNTAFQLFMGLAQLAFGAFKLQVVADQLIIPLHQLLGRNVHGAFGELAVGVGCLIGIVDELDEGLPGGVRESSELLLTEGTSELSLQEPVHRLTLPRKKG